MRILEEFCVRIGHKFLFCDTDDITLRLVCILHLINHIEKFTFS